MYPSADPKSLPRPFSMPKFCLSHLIWELRVTYWKCSGIVPFRCFRGRASQPPFSTNLTTGNVEGGLSIVQVAASLTTWGSAKYSCTALSVDVWKAYIWTALATNQLKSIRFMYITLMSRADSAARPEWQKVARRRLPLEPGSLRSAHVLRQFL